MLIPLMSFVFELFCHDVLKWRTISNKNKLLALIRGAGPCPEDGLGKKRSEGRGEGS